LAAIDRAIALFDPNVKSASIVPIIRRHKLETRFRHGAWTATVLDTLRNADGPLTVNQLGRTVADKFGTPYEKPVDVATLNSRIRTCLKKRGSLVVSEWNGSVNVWRLAPDNTDAVE
jgi:hypothetical protein